MSVGYHTNGDFLNAGGGSYQLNGESYEQTFDFNTEDTSLIRQPESFTYQMEGDQLLLTDKSSKGDPLHEVWEKVQ